MIPAVFNGFVNGACGGMGMPQNQPNHTRHYNYDSSRCHNGDASIADIAEHVGNGEYGSAVRDVCESQAVQAAVKDVLSTIGESLSKDQPGN